MKIFIIGISGSGKTYLSKILSKKYGVKKFDLDDVYWKKKYTEKRKDYEAEIILEQKVKELDEWIFEGIYSKWTSTLLKKSDKIVWLDMPKNLMTYRIFNRWLKRRKETKETIFEVLDLIRFQRSYRKVKTGKEKSFFEEHKDFVKNYKNKLTIIKNKKEFSNFLKNLK